jgi:hypothetical protein
MPKCVQRASTRRIALDRSGLGQLRWIGFAMMMDLGHFRSHPEFRARRDHRAISDRERQRNPARVAAEIGKLSQPADQ